MKTTFRIVLLAFITTIFFSCSEDTINNDPTSPSGSFKLSGTAENWTYGASITLSAILYDTGYNYERYDVDTDLIANDGTFSIDLRSVPDSLLYPVSFNLDSFCTSSVVVEPANVRISESLGLSLQSDSLNGYLKRCNYASDSTLIPGQFFVEYIYLDQNATLMGSIVCSFEEYTATVIYNFTGVKGWNKLVYYCESSNNFTSKYTISNYEPEGAKWYPHLWSLNCEQNKSSINKKLFRLDRPCTSCK